MKTILQSLRTLFALTVLTGFAYPLAVTAISQFVFSRTANGSLVVRDGKVVGSVLLAQENENPRYFQPRPSGANFATIPSGATNLGPTSAALRQSIAERRTRLGADAPDDLLTTSASGLDPHLSPASARYQASRVASARKIPVERVQALIDRHTEAPQFGFLGEARVNVLALNLALDATP